MQRPGVLAMAVVDERRGVVDEAVPVGEQPRDHVRVAAGLGGRAGVELGRERLRAQRRQDLAAERHVGAHANRPGTSHGEGGPVEFEPSQPPCEARLPLHPPARGRVERVRERRPGDAADGRVGELPRQAPQPAGRRDAVVVDERDDLRACRRDARVARVVEPAPVLAHVARAGGEHVGAAVVLARVVVDDDDLGRRRIEPRKPREQAAQVGGSPVRADDDRALQRRGRRRGGHAQARAQARDERVARGLPVGPAQHRRGHQRAAARRARACQLDARRRPALLQHEHVPAIGAREVQLDDPVRRIDRQGARHVGRQGGGIVAGDPCAQGARCVSAACERR